MFNFMKSKKNKDDQIDNKPTSKSWLKRLNEGLKRTRTQFSSNLANLILGKKTIDEDLLESLETSLLVADVGAEATLEILEHLRNQVNRKELKDPKALITSLKKELLQILQPCTQPLVVTHKPTVILMVGVNGAGKTTTIAKLTYQYQQEGKSIILAAGDTFRAAAIEQLQTWGNRHNVPVISQQNGADSASVIFDAMQATYSRNYDLLIADTAGRLHTQQPLMAELAKIKRVMAKIDETAPHETILVIDAGMGQNALHQAKQFHEAVGVSSIILTKLDGTAKGGIIFAIAKQMALPIHFIGIGEKSDDLKPFDAEAFVEALFERD